MGNATALPRRLAQPLGLRTDKDLRRYIESQRDTIDRLWSLLVRAISERHGAGLLAERPPPGVLNRTYLVTDTIPMTLSIDVGTAWKDINLP